MFYVPGLVRKYAKIAQTTQKITNETTKQVFLHAFSPGCGRASCVESTFRSTSRTWLCRHGPLLGNWRCCGFLSARSPEPKQTQVKTWTAEYVAKMTYTLNTIQLPHAVVFLHVKRREPSGFTQRLYLIKLPLRQDIFPNASFITYKKLQTRGQINYPTRYDATFLTQRCILSIKFNKPAVIIVEQLPCFCKSSRKCEDTWYHRLSSILDTKGNMQSQQS